MDPAPDDTRGSRGDPTLRDPLTGLPARALLLDRLQQALTHRHDEGEMVILLHVDLDRFQTVNDTLGHEGGDQILVDIAHKLGDVLRPDDTVARLGGDEFLVLCTDVGASGVSDLPRRILREIAMPILVDDTEVMLTASIGIAVARHAPHTPSDMLREASAACDAARRRGRNRFALFDDTVRDEAQGSYLIERSLRRAIHVGELELHYQPIFELSSRHLVGLEALARWPHPEHGMLDAGAFVPLAEECGLMGPIAAWSIAEACAEAARWPDRFGPVPGRTWVNVSASQLADPALEGLVQRTLEQTGLDPRRLGLEITETGIMRDPDTAVRTLASLRELGVAFALDDFGTGYSSLAHLRRFPIDVVKIDRTFVAELGRDDRTSAIVGAIVMMCRALDVACVAEGIENELQLAELRKLGCDTGQGFLLGEPVPAKKVGSLLAA
jgi:diguanylate cyclase (GGDEF)-like protein